MAENTQSPASSPDNAMVMAILAYIGPLVIVSFITSKDNPFVKFHIKQGLVLLVIEAVFWAAGSFIYIPFLWQIIGLLNLAVLVLSVLGIVNAVNKKEAELPVVGQFAKYFNF